MRYTQKQLKEWGFEKVEVSPEESGGAGYIYYTLDLDDRAAELISTPFEKGVRYATVEFFEGNKPLSKEFVEAIIKEFKK